MIKFMMHSAMYRKLAFPVVYNFSSLQAMKECLSRNLFSIQLINKQVNRRILAMAYSPGVGQICQEINRNKSAKNSMTLRSRSIAIVTDGSFLNTSANGVGPAMDWIVAQIKFYSGLDPFPFVRSTDSTLSETLKDLSISYGTVLYLDNKQLGQIPQDLLVVRHSDIISLTKTEITNCQKTANVLAYLNKNGILGLANNSQISTGLNHKQETFKNFKPYGFELKDGRNIFQHALQLHSFYNGKIHIELGFHDINKFKEHFTEKNLRQISKQKNPYSKTSRLSAIVTDGTAVLGFGNIGPSAGLPVMEGKSLLFKLLGDVQVVPVCINERKSPQQSIEVIRKMLGNFDAINLQDFAAPQCFDIEQGLNKLKLLPIFHDDQHGTAIVTLAGLLNAVKVVGKNLHQCKIVINGAGAAGITIAKLLLSYGVKDMIVCDSIGSIYKGRTKNMNNYKRQIADITNLQGKNGLLPQVLVGTDIFIGVSQQKALDPHWVSTMAPRSIIFALANPVPEILPHEAKNAGAMVYGSGRSDFENQINNSLVFPGIFRGISQHRIKVVTQQMKIKAAEAIASSIEGQPNAGYIIPDSLDKDVAIRIANEMGKIANKYK